MKRLISLFTAAVLLMGSITCLVYSESDLEEPGITEYIIKYDTQSVNEIAVQKGGKTAENFALRGSVEESFNAKLKSATDFTIIDELKEEEDGTVIQLVSIDTTDTETALKELNSVEGVVFAEPNYPIHSCDNDPEFINQWSINDSDYGIGIHVSGAWEITKGSSDLTVAVIDSGVDISHPDLAQNIFTNPNETQDGIDSDGNGFVDDVHGWDFTSYRNATSNGDNTVYDDKDEDEHGTHIAGIIAAPINGIGIEGVAPEVKVLPVKMMKGHEGTTFSAIKAIEYAQSMGAKIANCSWGNYYFSQFLYDCIKNSDMLFVCAVGNEGVNVVEDPCYPAMYNLDNIVSVAACDRQGNITDYSNYGQGVTIAAPGELIHSTLPEGRYGTKSGTSMAAPLIAGAAALLLSVVPDLTASEMINRIESSVWTYTQLAGKVDTSGVIFVSELVKTKNEILNFSQALYGAESVKNDQILYVIGGVNNEGFLNKYRYFDSFLGYWIEKDLIGTRAECAVGFYNNKLYLLGGRAGGSDSSYLAVHIQNLNNSSWDMTSGMPNPVYAMSYVQVGEVLYLFGGLNSGVYYNTVYAFNMATKEWTRKQDMPFKSAYGCAVNAGGTIYLIGGSNEMGCLDTIYTYDIQTDSFQQVSKMSHARKDFAAAYFNNKIYIFGGSSSYNTQGENPLLSTQPEDDKFETLLNSVEVFDIEKKSCSPADSLKTPCAGMTATVYNDNIYLMGGWNGSYSKEVTKYFGTVIPKNIKVTTNGTEMTVRWNPIAGISKYQIEFDGTIYAVDSNTYTAEVSEEIEHKIRVRAATSTGTSLWSDYIYHYSNATMLDAKKIETNGAMISDKLYNTGQEKWYKLPNDRPGSFSASLTNIPQGCSFLLQLYSAGGELLSTGVQTADGQEIKDFVLEPYAYYLKVSSLFGGDSQNSYSLGTQFMPSSDEIASDRVKSAFLKPSGVPDNVNGDPYPSEYSEYNENEDPPLEDNTKVDTPISGDSSDSEKGDNPSIEEEIFEASNAASIAPMSLYNDQPTEERGQLSSQGQTGTSSVTVPTDITTTKCKVVVCIIPDNESDIISMEWTGANTNYENFAWHYSSNSNASKTIYYITALLSRSTSVRTYNYQIKYDKKAVGSSGNYTKYTYIICDSTTNEDFNYNTLNDSPLDADPISVNLNSSATVTGKIDHPYDRDCYRLSVGANEKITAVLVSPEGREYIVSIYNNNCTTNSFKASEKLDGWYNSNALRSFASISTTASRDYMIKVNSRNLGYSADETYTLSIYRYRLSACGDLELNNSFENAQAKKSAFAGYLGSPTKMAVPIDFSIDSPMDIDRYAVDLNAGDKISIQMELPDYYTSSYEYRLEIHRDLTDTDTGIQYIAASYNNPDSIKTKFVTYIAEKTGTYYVAVRSISYQYNYALHGTLRVTKTPAASLDSRENKTNGCSDDFIFVTFINFFGTDFGITTATQLTQPSSISGSLDNELDVDWFKFKNGGESKTAAFTFTGAEAGHAGIIVYDSKLDLLTAGVNGYRYNFQANQEYYIAVFAKDGEYSNLIGNNNYTMSMSLEEPRNELVFNPLDWGTFIYVNNPELITEADLADNVPGSNRLLMSADNLSGVVDFQASHSVQKYMLDQGSITYDILLYNPTDQPVTVRTERIGYQLPIENNLAENEKDATTTMWACLKAWADFLQVDLKPAYTDNNKNVFSEESTFQGIKEFEYRLYEYNRNKLSELPNCGTYTIAPGRSVWMLGDAAPTMSKPDWSPFNLVSRLNVLNGGTINLGFAAFRDRNNVNAPEPAQYISSPLQRTYPAGVPDGQKEKDMDGKPKGIAFSAAEVETRTQWHITGSNQSFSPTVYNLSYPNGNKVDKWITQFNPVQDENNYRAGAESDILPLQFEDLVFDTRHSFPGLGNNPVSGTPPIDTAMPLGNYGVIERYYIDITNDTDSLKNVTYTLRNNAHVFVTYKDGDANWQTKLKALLNTEGDTWESYYPRSRAEMFTISVAPHETKQLIMEVILPNADNGGIVSELTAE